jgi:hypothetical protein
MEALGRMVLLGPSKSGNLRLRLTGSSIQQAILRIADATVKLENKRFICHDLLFRESPFSSFSQRTSHNIAAANLPQLHDNA